MKRVCANCYFWERCGSLSDAPSPMGTCRRYPPTVVWEAEPVRDRHGYPAPGGRGVWHVQTVEEDWCGEHVLTDAAAKEWLDSLKASFKDAMGSLPR